MRTRFLLTVVLLLIIIPGFTAFALTNSTRTEPPLDVVATSPSNRTPSTIDALYSLPTPTPSPPPTTTTTHYHPPKAKVVAQQAPPVAAAPRAPGPCGGWEGEIAARWPADQVARACRIMMCESGGNPTAANRRSTASGLWQALDSTWNRWGGYARALHAPASVQMDHGFALWQSRGWQPWVCR